MLKAVIVIVSVILLNAIKRSITDFCTGICRLDLYRFAECCGAGRVGKHGPKLHSAFVLIFFELHVGFSLHLT